MNAKDETRRYGKKKKWNTSKSGNLLSKYVCNKKHKKIILPRLPDAVQFLRITQVLEHLVTTIQRGKKSATNAQKNWLKERNVKLINRGTIERDDNQ